MISQLLRQAVPDVDATATGQPSLLSLLAGDKPQKQRRDMSLSILGFSQRNANRKVNSFNFLPNWDNISATHRPKMHFFFFF
jgi:hypothetical protein